MVDRVLVETTNMSDSVRAENDGSSCCLKATGTSPIFPTAVATCIRGPSMRTSASARTSSGSVVP